MLQLFVLFTMENYPQSEVRFEVTRLRQVYTDVNSLATQIEPVLEIPKSLLSELICDCNSIASVSESSSSQEAIAYHQTRHAIESLMPVNETISSEQMPEEQAIDPAIVALEGSISPTLASKNLVFRFGTLGRSISMQDLTYFAETFLMQHHINYWNCESHEIYKICPKLPSRA